MNTLETAQLLTIASGIDGIRRTREQVTVWEAVLTRVPYELAHGALIEHFADPDTGTEFLKPAHITRILARNRTAEQLKPQLPTECPLHPHYPLPCVQCVRYPEDRILGIVPPRKAIGDLLDTYQPATAPTGDTQ
jgi:hypothetical protein